MRKITAALSAGIVALLASTVEGKDHCTKPLPKVTDENFGAELYKKAKYCNRNIIYKDEGYMEKGTRVVFKSNGVRYTLQISPNDIDIHFRRDGTRRNEDTGFIADYSEDPNNTYNSSNKLDSICEIVVFEEQNGLISKEDVPVALRHNARPVSDSYFHYGGLMARVLLKRSHTPQEYDFAQKVCQRVLHEVREFYNRNGRRKE